MDSKKPPVKKSKAKKPKAKKPKPKPKTKQKQKQAQTQNVIINLSDIRKRTRRKMTGSGGKRPLPLSSFSGSAQAPIYVNPHGSTYRDLIRPLQEHQREMRAAAQNDLRRSDQQRELLRSEFKKSQAGQSAINKALIDALRETKQRGNVEQETPPPTAGDLEDPIGDPTVGDLEDLTPDPIGESSSAPTKEEKPKKKVVRNKEQDKATRAKTKERRDRAALTNTDNETEVKPAKARKSSRNTAKNGSFGGVLGSLED